MHFCLVWRGIEVTMHDVHDLRGGGGYATRENLSIAIWPLQPMPRKCVNKSFLLLTKGFLVYILDNG